MRDKWQSAGQPPERASYFTVSGFACCGFLRRNVCCAIGAATAALILLLSAPVSAQTPDHRHIVQRTFASGWDISTREGVCAFVEAAVTALHQHDESWGFLKKRQPQNGCYKPGALEGVSIDTAYYKGTRQTIDFMVDCQVGCKGIGWGISGTHMNLDDWIKPETGTIVPNPGIPPFDPTPVYTQLREFGAQLGEFGAQLGALGVELEALRRLVQMQQLEIEHLRAGQDLLAARPVYSKCSARVLGIPVSCRLEPSPND